MKRIPFKNEFLGVIAAGLKTATSRRRRYGNVGDRFRAFNLVIELTEVTEMPLHEVATEHYLEEGFTDTESFIAIWCELYPIKKYQPDQLVWFHRFKIVG